METENKPGMTSQEMKALKKDIHNGITMDVREKMKKNVLYVGMFSIFMAFGGLTSGYIVSMGDSFWVKFPMPNGFWISTTVIILSSIFIQLGISFAKKGNQKLSKMFVVLTFVFGLLFVYYQFKGYSQLAENGSHLRGDIMVVDGRYGSSGDDGRYYGYYEIKKDGKFIEISGNDYLYNGKKMTDAQFSELQKVVAPFEKYSEKSKIDLSGLNDSYTLYYKQQPISILNGELCLPDSSKLEFDDLNRLKSLAINIGDKRGDFFIKGQIGKDFHVYYKRKELNYKNRMWEFNGQVLDDYLQTKPLESPDTASSYLWLITLLHLAHILFTLFYMGKMTIYSLSGRFTAENTLSLKLGAIFWHFLGILWVYLLLFLLFIH